MLAWHSAIPNRLGVIDMLLANCGAGSRHPELHAAFGTAPPPDGPKRRQLATASDHQAIDQKLCNRLHVVGYILVAYRLDRPDAMLWSAWVSGWGSAIEHMARFEVAVMNEVTTRKHIRPHIETKMAMGGRSVEACVAAG